MAKTIVLTLTEPDWQRIKAQFWTGTERKP